jgi:hypothetical protein
LFSLFQSRPYVWGAPSVCLSTMFSYPHRTQNQKRSRAHPHPTNKKDRPEA